MADAPPIFPIEFDDPAAFQSAWSTIVSLASCFVPDVDLPPQTALVVEISGGGLGPVKVPGHVAFADVDSYGRNGVVVTLDATALADARAVFEPSQKPGFATTMLKATPAPDASSETRPPARVADAAPEPESKGHLEPGTLLDGRFQIEGHLATGGMGDVYRAAHVYLKRPIALKLLKRSLSNDPDMWARFQREAEVVSQLESPHIVRVFDFGKTSDGQPFLAMEFVEGTTLDHVLSRAGALRPVRAVDLVLQICEGLEEAHAMGIVHRDLKPPNIMIGRRRDGSEVAKILDFGIARIADKQKASSLTQLGMVIGTPAYLSPEQALADTLDARTDIYALGCVAYEVLTGRPPFVKEELAKLVAAHLHETPAPLESVRAELAAFPVLCKAVLKCLEKDRANRFQDVGTLALAFAASVEAEGTGSGATQRTGSGATAAEGSAVAQVPVPTTERVPDASAFEDWPVAEVVPDSAPAPASAAEIWPPPEPAKLEAEAPPPPAPEAQGQVDDFFGGALPSAPKPATAPATATATPTAAATPTTRLERELQAAQISLQPERIQKLVARREALKSGNGIALLVTVTGAPARSAVRAASTTHVIRIGAIHGGVVDHTDEDATLLFFPGEDSSTTGGRALMAALAMREAVAEERAALAQPISLSLHVVAGAGRAEVPPNDAPLTGELTARVRRVGAKATAGQVLLDKSLARELDDLLELRDAGGASGLDVVDAGERKLLLTAAAQKLLGREAPMEALDKRLSGLASGTVAPVVVLGASGVGKSAVAQELAMRARHRSFVVGMARGLRSMRGTPYAALAEVLCNVCGVPKDKRLTGLRTALEKLNLPSAEIEAALVVAGVQQLPRPLTPGQAVHTLRTVMATGAAGRKVVLIFDGLESADRFSVDAFLELVTAPRASELTVGFAEPAWARERLPRVPSLTLEPLTRDEVNAWLSSVLPDSKISNRLAELLFTRSRGNPGIVLDWLHLLGDRGLLRKRGQHWVLTGEPPALDANELARERLQALGAYARRIFEAASIAGDAIDSAAISALVPDAPPSAYQRVVNSRLLRAVGGKRWAVASDRYLAAALGEKTTSVPLMHQRFAALLVERARTAGETPDASHVAEHLTHAGDGLKAMPIWRRAAEQALTRRAARDAVLAFKGWADALALMPGGDGKAPEVARARLDALSRAAGNALACDDAVLARSLVDDGLALARTAKLITAELQLMIARVLRSEARRAKSAEALQQAEKLARGTPIHALCWFELGEVKEAEGDVQGAIGAYKNASAMGETAAELARWYGEVDFRAAIEVRLAGLAETMDPPSAKKLYASALTRLRTANAPFQEAWVLGLSGKLSFSLGEYPDAIRALEESANAAARAGDLLFQARQLVVLSRALAKGEQSELAWKRAEAARRLAMSVGWVEGRRDAEQVLAHLKAKQVKA